MLASYATDPKKTKGRLYPEKPTPYRNEFQRDKDRIIHSNSFRRLQYKTQVFINHEGDHYRNRLTHSIEVSTIARSIAKDLGVSEDLADCIALAHDLGHTPFGHVGEEALRDEMQDYGGFCHNAHAIKLLTELEKRYGSYAGLNLTWEVIEGTAKHNGPILGDPPEAVREYNSISDLKLGEYSSLEAQIAAISDDVTYICHDLEDGVMGYILEIGELEEINRIKPIVRSVIKKFPNLEKSRQIFEIVREITHILLEDLLAETKSNIKKSKVKTSEDIRKLDMQLVCFSKEIEELVKETKSFLLGKLYSNHRLMLTRYKCKKVVKGLFKMYFSETECMPIFWQERAKGDATKRARAVSDYIAGMTDRFAIDQYNSLSLQGNV